MSSKILLLGNDLPLLEIREAVLRFAGLPVAIAFGTQRIEAALQDLPIGVFVLCHSVPHHWKVKAVEAIRERTPDAKILLLTGVVDERPLAGCQTLSVFAGPVALIGRISEMLERVGLERLREPCWSAESSRVDVQHV